MFSLNARLADLRDERRLYRNKYTALLDVVREVRDKYRKAAEVINPQDTAVACEWKRWSRQLELALTRIIDEHECPPRHQMNRRAR